MGIMKILLNKHQSIQCAERIFSFFMTIIGRVLCMNRSDNVNESCEPDLVESKNIINTA